VKEEDINAESAEHAEKKTREEEARCFFSF
jgi:hypothetical protein